MISDEMKKELEVISAGIKLVQYLPHNYMKALTLIGDLKLRVSELGNTVLSESGVGMPEAMEDD